jgi:hypothetical protein
MDTSEDGPEVWSYASVLDALPGMQQLAEGEKNLLRELLSSNANSTTGDLNVTAEQHTTLASILQTASSPEDLEAKLSQFCASAIVVDAAVAVESAQTVALKDALKKIKLTNGQTVKSLANVKATLKQLEKMMEGVIKACLTALTKNKPLKSNKSSKILTKNIIFKKFIAATNGAEAFLAAVGYSRTTEKKKEYLILGSTDVQDTLTVVQEAFRLLTATVQEVVSEGNQAPDTGPRVKCAGGCGFFGDRKQENYCSKCFKDKYVNGGDNTAAASTAAEPPANPELKEAPVRCIAKCGFFGSIKFRGMCSMCFKKDPNFGRTTTERWRSAKVKLSALAKLRKGIRPQQTNIKACWHCKRKVGYEGIQCKCRYYFCGHHRYPDEHDCPYDHRKLQRKRLETKLQKLAALKFERIDSQYER